MRWIEVISPKYSNKEWNADNTKQQQQHLYYSPVSIQNVWCYLHISLSEIMLALAILWLQITD